MTHIRLSQAFIVVYTILVPQPASYEKSKKMDLAII